MPPNPVSPKNDTVTLVVSLLLTLGLLGGAGWWVAQRSGWLKSAPWTNQSGLPNGNASSFAEVLDVPSGLFNYGGSTTWAPIRREFAPVLQMVWPKFQLRYTDPIVGAPGSGTGLRMLLDNQLAFAESSRPINDDEYRQAEQRGFRLKEIPVAIDGIAIAVNPGLNLSGLTLDQLKGIYTGKILNWRQVGGRDLPIVPYSRRPEDGGTVEFFSKNVLGGEAFAPTVVYIATTTQALRSVATNPGGIYYASAPEVVGQCTVKTLAIGRQSTRLTSPEQLPQVPLKDCPARRNQLNAEAFQSGQYPITRRLFVIVKQNGQADQQAGEAYANLLLTEQGQDLIAKAGFVQIR